MNTGYRAGIDTVSYAFTNVGNNRVGHGSPWDNVGQNVRLLSARIQSTYIKTVTFVYLSRRLGGLET